MLRRMTLHLQRLSALCLATALAACVNGGAGNTYRTYWTMTLGTAR